MDPAEILGVARVITLVNVSGALVANRAKEYNTSDKTKQLDKDDDQANGTYNV